MRRWSPNRSNGLTTVGVPNLCIRRHTVGETARRCSSSGLDNSDIVVVVGQRDGAALAIGMIEAGDGEVAGVRMAERPGMSAWWVQVEVVDALVVAVDHDEPPAERVQRLGEQLAGASVAADEEERLVEPLHLAGEVLQGERLAEAALLHQREHSA